MSVSMSRTSLGVESCYCHFQLLLNVVYKRDFIDEEEDRHTLVLYCRNRKSHYLDFSP